MARKILLADDSVTAQNMGRKILADAGYEVITVNNGSAALKRISEQRPDLIVLDVYMPGYSGLEVCQRLKETAETSRIPVLLTVGKLEPFKPEEAKRVRAEGFIVKPFEASELLSALSRLEDKVVPRSESPKPGRFARAIAAVENRDRIMAVEEETGWKNRIAFPSKKKKKEEKEEDGKSESAVHDGVAKASESTVDVSAVAGGLPGESLPKDVTAEEIAAIAAAAAQVQNAAAVTKEVSETQAKTAAEASSAEQKSEMIERPRENRAEEVPPATFAEHKTAERVESAEAETAEQKLPEKREDQKDARTIPGESEVVAAITAFESGGGKAWNASGSGNGAGSSAVAGDTPVTMAAAAAGSSGPRWTAVPVAMDASESAISLEQEMQRAMLVGPEATAGSTAAVSAAPASAESVTAATAIVAERVAHAASREESELAQALSAVANVAAEAVTSAMTELATMAASHADALPPAPAGALALPVQATEALSSEVQTWETAEGMGAPAAHIAKPEVEEGHRERAEANMASVPTAEASSMSARESQSVGPVSAAPEVPRQNESAAGGTREMSENRESEMSSSGGNAWASWRPIRSDEARTQELANARKDRDQDDEPAFASEAAAMAVAAGAEKSPDGGTAAADPAAIANIVDSVLADLRPKIVEEIAKKLGKK